jgi:hypothetical protein
LETFWEEGECGEQLGLALGLPPSWGARGEGRPELGAQGAAAHVSRFAPLIFQPLVLGVAENHPVADPLGNFGFCTLWVWELQAGWRCEVVALLPRGTWKTVHRHRP